MRRWSLLLAGAALWLFLAAVPALADGGPHVKTINNGQAPGGLTADTCAGCHRAHTGNGEFLLTVSEETTLCLTCHGAGGTGATTNVVNGVQYVPSTLNAWNRTGTILGALRDGGFVTAAIGSDKAYKTMGALMPYGYASTAKVPVMKDAGGTIAGAPVTSAHMPVPGSPLSGFTGTTWGNITKTDGGPTGSTIGATGGTLECGACHNPHGNGNYRILQPQPVVAGSADFQAAAAPGVAVTDAPLPPATDTRNYTVIQTAGGAGTLLASQAGAYSPVAGDYLRRTVPWSGGGANDAPNGVAATFNAQINAWCVTCHTRYLSTGGEDPTNANAIFHSRHYSANSTRTPVCTTCHVGHGSNAAMTPGGYSASVNYPGDPVGTASRPGDSRLLKVDNRGICQTCHDPTGTLTTGDSVGTLPNPLTP